MSEDKVRSIFEIDYTRWILTTLLGLILYLTPEIAAYYSVPTTSEKLMFLEYFGLALLWTSVIFLVGVPNCMCNLFHKNKIKKERDISQRLRHRLKESINENRNILMKHAVLSQKLRSRK